MLVDQSENTEEELQPAQLCVDEDNEVELKQPEEDVVEHGKGEI